MSIYAAVAIYRVHWGISVRTPFGSAVQQSQMVPPPTTLAGALAVAAVKNGLLGAREFYGENGVVVSGALKAVRELGLAWAVAGWLTPFINTTVLVRYFSGPYRSRAGDVIGPARGTKHVNILWSPVGIGYNVAPRGLLQAVYMARTKKHVERIAKAAAHVSRIGSKESFVDPLWVGECRLEDRGSELVSTVMPAPIELIDSKSLEGSYTLEQMPWPVETEEWQCWFAANPGACKTSRIYVIKDILVPLPPGGVRVRPSKARSYEIRLDSCKPVIEISGPRRLEPIIAPGA